MCEGGGGATGWPPPTLLVGSPIWRSTPSPGESPAPRWPIVGTRGMRSPVSTRVCEVRRVMEMSHRSGSQRSRASSLRR